MKHLIEGILKYRDVKLPQRRELFRRLGEGQNPDTLFIACSDSRVVPTLFVSSEPGDLFEVRTVGNLVAPAMEDGLGANDVSEAAAVEYAILVLGVKHIVVCGHSKCGAMRAIAEGQVIPGAANLTAWLSNAKPLHAHQSDTLMIERVAHEDEILPEDNEVDLLSRANVLLQLEHLRSYPLVREREEKGTLFLHPWWFDVSTGDVYVHSVEREGFVLIDEGEVNRSHR